MMPVCRPVPDMLTADPIVCCLSGLKLDEWLSPFVAFFSIIGFMTTNIIISRQVKAVEFIAYQSLIFSKVLSFGFTGKKAVTKSESGLQEVKSGRQKY
jgi:hypothetical protein